MQNFTIGRTAFINGNNDKALVLLSESASKARVFYIEN